MRRGVWPTRPGRWRAGAAAWLAACSAALAATPAPGDHDAQLCVVTPAAPAPNCGPARVRLRAGEPMRVRVDDIVYLLAFGHGRVDVVVMHGAVQVDAFSATAAWAGRALRFEDADRQVSYEVQLAPSRGAPKHGLPHVGS